MKLHYLGGDLTRNRTIHELELGYLRYEVIRKMNPMQFAELCRRNINGEGKFDDLVDAEIEKEANHEH